MKIVIIICECFFFSISTFGQKLVTSRAQSLHSSAFSFLSWPGHLSTAAFSFSGREPGTVRWQHDAMEWIWEKLLPWAQAVAIPHCFLGHTSLLLRNAGNGEWVLDPASASHSPCRQAAPCPGTLPYLSAAWVCSWVLIALPFQRPKCFPGGRDDSSLWDQENHSYFKGQEG